MNINEKKVPWVTHKQNFTATEFICLSIETYGLQIEWTKCANILTELEQKLLEVKWLDGTKILLRFLVLNSILLI